MIDDKEQVIEFELTEKGKQLLMLGKMKPAYYSFSDDDILYDSSYGDVEENQNDIITRILDTPRINLNPRIKGAETAIKEITSRRVNDEEIFIEDIEQEQAERVYTSNITLGNASATDNLSPAWNIRFWSGELLTSSHLIEKPNETFSVRVPQITTNGIRYTVSKISQLPDELMEEMQNEGIISHDKQEWAKLDDGTLVEIVKRDMFIDVEELGTMFKNDSFDLEIFEIQEYRDTNNEVRERLRPLYWSKQSDMGELWEETPLFGDDEDSEDMVDLYLDVRVDREISPEVICRYVPREKRRGIYDSMYGCEDKKTTRLRSLQIPENTIPSDERDRTEDC